MSIRTLILCANACAAAAYRDTHQINILRAIHLGAVTTFHAIVLPLQHEMRLSSTENSVDNSLIRIILASARQRAGSKKVDAGE
jgi:hypothetical protein